MVVGQGGGMVSNVPQKSIPLTLFIMGRWTDAMAAIRDCLYVGKDFLVPQEYTLLVEEMMKLVDDV